MLCPGCCSLCGERLDPCVESTRWRLSPSNGDLAVASPTWFPPSRVEQCASAVHARDGMQAAQFPHCHPLSMQCFCCTCGTSTTGQRCPPSCTKLSVTPMARDHQQARKCCMEPTCIEPRGTPSTQAGLSVLWRPRQECFLSATMPTWQCAVELDEIRAHALCTWGTGSRLPGRTGTAEQHTWPAKKLLVAAVHTA